MKIIFKFFARGGILEIYIFVHNEKLKYKNGLSHVYKVLLFMFFLKIFTFLY